MTVSSDFEQLCAVLQGNVERAEPVFANTDVVGARHRDQLRDLLDAATWSLDPQTVTEDSDALTVTGRSSILGSQDAETTVHVSDEDGAWMLRVNASLRTPAKLAQSESSSVALEVLGVETQYGPLNTVSSARWSRYDTRLILGSLDIPMVAESFPDTPGFRLSLSSDPIPLGRALQILQMVGAEASVGRFVAKLGSRVPFVLDALSLVIDPANLHISDFHCRLSSDVPLTLVDDRLTIVDLTADVSLGTVFGDGPSDLVVQVRATLSAAGRSIPVLLTLDVDDGHLQIAVSGTETLRLDSLGELLDLAGLETGQIPGWLGGVSDLCLPHLEINVDLDHARVLDIQGHLAAGEMALVKNFPALRFVEMPFSIAPTTGVVGEFTAMLVGDDLNVALQGSSHQTLSVTGTVEQVHLRQLVQLILPVESDALPDVSLTDVSVSIEDETLRCAATLSADLNEVCGQLSIGIPDSVPTVDLSHITVVMDGASGDWSIDVSCPQQVAFLDDDAVEVSMSDVRVGLSGGKRKKTSTSASFMLHGSVSPAQSVTLALKQLTSSWDGNRGVWRVTGNASATLWSKTYELQAGIEQTGDHYTFFLHHTGKIPLVAWDRVGEVTVRNLRFFVERGNSGTGKGSKPKWGFGVSGDSTVTIPQVFSAMGDLTLEKGAQRSALMVRVTQPTIGPIKLPVETGRSPEIRPTFSTVFVRYERDQETGKANWLLQGAGQVAFAHIPAIVERYFPADPLRAEMRIGSTGVQLSCTWPKELNPEFPRLAVKLTEERQIDLGQPVVRVERLLVTIDGDVELAAELFVGLPYELNFITGMNSRGKPNSVFLEKSFRARLSIARRPTITLLSSPVKALKFYEYRGKIWSTWDFGDLGKVRFQTPEFSYAMGRWQASGGVERLGDLHLPLGPVRFLLEQCDVPAPVVKALPRRLPLRGVDLGSDDLFHDIERLLGSTALRSLPKSARDLLREGTALLQNVLKRMPLRLRDYLKVHVPETFYFDIAVGAGGSVKIGLHTADARPLKFLFPMMLMPPVPELVGFTLRGFSLGEALGGSLIILDVDGHIDRFDLPTLIAAGTVLPTTVARKLSNRIILRKTLAVLPTALPIPIPLFYDEVGVELRALPGVELQSHWHYPRPEAGFFGLIDLFGQLFDFVSQRDYLLHQQDPPEGMNLTFTVGSNFLRLPDYLGGVTLGTTDGLPPISVYQSVALLLDALKTGNVGYLIRAIPLQHKQRWIRIGQREVRFGPVKLAAAWCITTEREFVEQVLPNPKARKYLGTANADGVLESLPARMGAPAWDKGFVVLLMGEWTVTGVMGLQTQFGLSATRAGGFETGFRIRGSIADRLALTIGGVVQASEKRFYLAGYCRLTWQDNTLIALDKAEVEVTNTSFRVGVQVAFSTTLQLRGNWLITRKSMAISGGISWRYSSQSRIDADAEALFSPDGISLAFTSTVFDTKCQIGIVLDAKRGESYALLDLSIGADLQKALHAQIQRQLHDAEAAVDQTAGEVERALQSLNDVTISLNGLRKAIPPILQSIHDRIRSEIDGHVNRKAPKVVRGTIRRKARAKAEPYRKRLRTLKSLLANASDDATRDLLKRAINEVLKHKRISFSISFKIVLKKRRFGVSKVIIDGALERKLRQLIKYIDEIPARRGVHVSATRIQEEAQAVTKAVRGVARDITSSVAENIPAVESIRVRTGLTRITKGGNTATVVIRHRGKRSESVVDLNFGDIRSTIETATKAFLST